LEGMVGGGAYLPCSRRERFLTGGGGDIGISKDGSNLLITIGSKNDWRRRG